MSSTESKAQSIMYRELRKMYETSYQELRELSYTGYTNLYLQKTANFSNLKTTAKLSVVAELADCDLPGIENF